MTRTFRLFMPDYGQLAEKEVYRRHLLVGERAVEEGLAKLEYAPRAGISELRLVHTERYVEALETGQPVDLACTGGVWFPGSLDIHLSVLGAYLGGLEAALTDGIAGIPAGGGHHAFPEHGGALCPMNDVAIGIHWLRRRGIRKILVLDLDAHFGNGTAACIPNDPDVFLFDYHGHVSAFSRPDTPHLFRNFHAEPDARLYLQSLRKELPRVLDDFQPELCIYGAGMDVFLGTPNPPLRLRFPDIEKRDTFVFDTLADRQIPVAYVHSGGYAGLETVVSLHLFTARAAFASLGRYEGFRVQ